MSDIAAENDVSRSIRPAEAVKAWQSIEKSAVKIVAEKAKAWHNWTKVIGPFILERRAKATAETGTTRGPTYAPALEKALGQFYPIYKRLSDNGSISRLLKVMDNLEAIEKWLAKQPADDRPSHPNRVWAAFEDAKKGKIISFKDEAPAELLPDQEDEDDGDGDEDSGEDKPAKKRPRRNKDAERERRVEELEEELGRYRLSTDPELNAERIWLALQAVVGPKPAVDLARATAERLEALIDRVEGMWKEAS